MKRNIVLQLQYRGGNYHGFQLQLNALSIQEVLENALARLCGEQIRVNPASRTDAGVHALAQVVHFHTNSKIPIEAFHRGLQHFIPDDIRIVSAEEKDLSFHSRWSARGKRYHYYINFDERQRILLDPFSWFIPRPLDIESMNAAAVHLVGIRDFSSFRSSGCSSKHAIRQIYQADWSVVPYHPFFGEGRLLRFAIFGNAFLKHMVRAIVGTLVEVGKGELNPEQFRAIVEAKDRTKASMTAPARGLFLVEIFYEQLQDEGLSAEKSLPSTIDKLISLAD